MRVIETPLAGMVLLELPIHRDARGHFLEAWQDRRYADAGLPDRFVQDNVSVSGRNVLRGLHYQSPRPQGKLVTVLDGEVWDVGVDLRAGSPTFGRWHGCPLAADSGQQLYLPPGFAHGFVVTSDRAVVAYKCTDYYAPDAEHTLLWNDPALGIEWPVEAPILSEKDRNARPLAELSAVAV